MVGLGLFLFAPAVTHYTLHAPRMCHSLFKILAWERHKAHLWLSVGTAEWAGSNCTKNFLKQSGRRRGPCQKPKQSSFHSTCLRASHSQVFSETHTFCLYIFRLQSSRRLTPFSIPDLCFQGRHLLPPTSGSKCLRAGFPPWPVLQKPELQSSWSPPPQLWFPLWGMHFFSRWYLGLSCWLIPFIIWQFKWVPTPYTEGFGYDLYRPHSLTTL